MQVYHESNELLKGYKPFVTTEDGMNSYIIDDAADRLVYRYFKTIDVLTWWSKWVNYFESRYVTSSNNGKFWLNGEKLVSGITSVYVKNRMIYNGYMLTKYGFQDSGGNITNGLLVCSIEGGVIGFIHSTEGRNTPELAKLIIQTPEIDWEV